METFSALLAICAGNSPVPGEFPTQRPVTRSFDVYFDLRPNKRLSKQSWFWWFETPSWPLWRHCSDKSNKLGNWLRRYSFPGHQNVLHGHFGIYCFGMCKFRSIYSMKVWIGRTFNVHRMWLSIEKSLVKWTHMYKYHAKSRKHCTFDVLFSAHLCHLRPSAEENWVCEAVSCVCNLFWNPQWLKFHPGLPPARSLHSQRRPAVGQ